VVDAGIAIKDIRMQDGSVRVVTNGMHMFRSKIRGPAPVILSGSCKFYDGEYCARVICKDELELLDHKGKPFPPSFVMDTSCGYLHHKFPWQLVNSTVVLGLPPWVVMFLGSLMLMLFLAIKTTHLTEDYVGLQPELVIALNILLSIVMAVAIEAWRRSKSRMQRLPPIMLRIAAYQRHLIWKGWRYRASPRGPSRALTAGKVRDMNEYFSEYIGSRTMYYICQNIVEPLTRERQISYSELVGPSQVQWFISHFWGSPFQEFVNAIVRHAQGISLEWKDVAYWVCTFANNQWQVREELGGGDWQQSSFFMALQSPGCKGTIMVMDPLAKPLTRSWCLFELLQTFLRQARGDDFSFLIGTANGVLNQKGFTDIQLTVRIGEAIANLDVQDASASDLADKKMIDALVNNLPGGFGRINSFIRTSVLDVLQDVRGNVLQGLTRLEQMLVDSSTLSEDASSRKTSGAGQRHVVAL